MSYHQRVAEPNLLKLLEFFSSVAVTGPRQSGKSSLIKHCLPDYRYVNFDYGDVRAQFYDDPRAFMRVNDNRVIFDEVQKVPEIFDYIKASIDEDRDNPGKYVLSGSSQFNMMSSISESLAGRIGLLTLLPYQFSEVPDSLRLAMQYQGGYPELVNKAYRHSYEWFAAYLDTYLAKDVRDFGNVTDLNAFMRLIRLLAAQVGQQLNYTGLASDLGLSVKTIEAWVGILQASYIIYLLPPFYNNYGKRIIKAPKVYFYDVGLVSYLTGIETQKQYANGPLAGHIFENYIVMEVLKKQKHNNVYVDLYYLRDSNGVEVDLIIDHKRYCEFIEIKKSETFYPRMAKNLKRFIEENNKYIVLYCGESGLPIDSKIKLKNYQDYLLESISLPE